MELIKTRKKVYTLFAVVLIGISLFVGCGDSKNTNTNSGDDTNISPNDDVSQQSDNQGTENQGTENQGTENQGTENQETENQGENDNIAKYENVEFIIPTLQEYLDLIGPLVVTEDEIDENGYQHGYDASGNFILSKRYENNELKYYQFNEYDEAGKEIISAKYEANGNVVFYYEYDADGCDVRGTNSNYNEDKGCHYITNYSAPWVKLQTNWYRGNGMVSQIAYYKNDIIQKIVVYDESGMEEYTEVYEYESSDAMRAKSITTKYAKDGFSSVYNADTGETTYYNADGNIVDYADWPY